MAHVILRCEIDDDDEMVRDYGITQMADGLVDDASGGYTGWTFTIVEVDGPDQPTACHRCGCAPHDDVACPNCTHPHCREEVVA